MAQMTEDFAARIVEAGKRGEHSPLTAWEESQLAYGWLEWRNAQPRAVPAERMPEGQVDLQSHIMRTAVAHGGLRQLSRDLSIDVGYLSRLANGEKTEPGEEILAKLGLEKCVVYLSKQAEFMRACEQESQSNG